MAAHVSVTGSLNEGGVGVTVLAKVQTEDLEGPVEYRRTIFVPSKVLYRLMVMYIQAVSQDVSDRLSWKEDATSDNRGLDELLADFDVIMNDYEPDPYVNEGLNARYKEYK